MEGAWDEEVNEDKDLCELTGRWKVMWSGRVTSYRSGSGGNVR